MSVELDSVLAGAAIAPDERAGLVARVAAPPAGTLDETDSDRHGTAATRPDRARRLLVAAIVAATDLQRFAASLTALLRELAPLSVALDDYDYGRYCHLAGFAAWRLEQRLDRATDYLNRSVTSLNAASIGNSHDPRAARYLARVSDTFGQLLHHQGLYDEARSELQFALGYRESVGDPQGAALTLGNLGRLCMEVGDFAAAEGYLQTDLALVEEHAADSLGVRTQLTSHLGDCALELGRLDQADARFRASLALAESDTNEVAIAFAVLGLARVAAARGSVAQARPWLARAQQVLGDEAGATIPPGLRHGMEGIVQRVEASLRLAEGRTDEALQAFEAAREHLALAAEVSPVESASLLYGYGKALARGGDGQAAAQMLREALRSMDATAADELRARIEGDLKERFHDSWLLHAAGRFLGQRQIEFLLSEAGRGGFRGQRREVVILFSDIRGFTGLAEHLEPDELIVFLNDYLRLATRCVEHFGGMVDKFIGDAVMALFSLPEPRADDADRALQAVSLMRGELERVARRLPAGSPRLQVGAGLHRGEVVAGLIGSPQKRSYTVIGDAVNTASRVEGMTKQLGASTLITRELLEHLAEPERHLLRPLGTFTPKGRGASVTVIDWLGEDDAGRRARELGDEIAQAEAALALREAGHFAEAAAAYAALAELAEGTPRVRGYRFIAEQMRAFAKRAPPSDWHGAIELYEK
jgi:class 3 adenylate cyclase/Tfp pilus assembly protein PilF